MSLPFITFTEADLKLNWLDLISSLESGHKLPKAKVHDVFMNQDKNNILQSVQLATADLETLKGQPKYLTTMQNQFDIDEKTAKAWKSGDKKAEAIVNEAVNKQVAGRFGLQAKPVLDANSQVTEYDYIKEGKTSVDRAPNKSMTAQKSQALLSNYLEDFNLSSQNNLTKDELIANTL